jgi:pimeloyl-ACP methyl ester carboxylesterase
VTAKTQFVWGARDGLAKPKYGRAYAKLLPKSEFVSVPGAGHFPHVEKPDSFDPILEKFLR